MEGEVAEDIAGEAGIASEAVEVRARRAGRVAVEGDLGSVGHVEDIRHVGGGRDIEDGKPGLAIPEEVEHGRAKNTGV